MGWEHVYFRYLSPSVNSCHVDVSADAPVKSYVDDSNADDL